MIRKSLLADQTAEELAKKLKRPPTGAELAAKLGLLSEAHLQLMHANKRSANVLMLRHNYRLVVHVAQKYSHRGVDLPDLVAVGGILWFKH